MCSRSYEEFASLISYDGGFCDISLSYFVSPKVYGPRHENLILNTQFYTSEEITPEFFSTQLLRMLEKIEFNYENINSQIAIDVSIFGAVPSFHLVLEEIQRLLKSIFKYNVILEDGIVRLDKKLESSI